MPVDAGLRPTCGTGQPARNRRIVSPQRPVPWTGRGAWIGVTRDELTEAQAKAAGFAHIRIQTHGMQLHRRDYLDRLVAAVPKQDLLNFVSQHSA